MEADENEPYKTPTPRNEEEIENQNNILLNNEKCDQCGMMFTSSDSLRIHKEKFCIGLSDSGVNRTNSPPIQSKYIQKINGQNDDDENGSTDPGIYQSNSPPIQSKYIQKITNRKDDDDDVTEPGLFQSNSPPIQSKFKDQKDDENIDFNDDLNDELDLEKSIRNEGLDEEYQNYEELDPIITNRSNKNISLKNPSISNQQLTSRSKINSRPNENREDFGSLSPQNKNLSIYSNLKNNRTPAESLNNLSRIDPKEKLTSRSKLNSPPNENLENNDDFGDLTPHNKNLSVYSNTKDFRTPSENFNNSISNKQQSNSVNNSKISVKTESAIDEVKKFKSKKLVEQSLQDLEDTLVRDTIRDKKLVNKLNKSQQIASSLDRKQENIKIPDDDPYKRLLKEYGDLKKKEKDILKEVYEFNPDFKTYSMTNFEKDSDFLKHDFLSLFDTFDDIDLELLDSLSLSNFGYKPKMNEETRISLKRIQEKTEQLERERRDIQLKLEALKNNTSYPLPLRSNPSVNRLLSELKDQQTLNEAALTLLRDRIVSGNSVSNPFPVRSGLLPPLYNSPTKVTSNPYLLNGLNDTDLGLEEIRNMRLNYLQSGGHDSNILNRFTEMEYNARFPNRTSVRPGNAQIQFSSGFNADPLIEDDVFINQNNKFKPTLTRSQVQLDLKPFDDIGADNFPLVSEILAKDVAFNPNAAELENRIQKIDVENKRIQAELELLQNKLAYASPAYVDQSKRFQNINLPPIQQPILPPPPPPPQTNQFYNAFQSNSPGFNGNPYNQNYQNNRNAFNNQDQYQTQRGQNQQSTRAPSNFRQEPPVQNQNLIKLKDLPPAPYDPNGGFVLFIDFVTNIDPNYASARVITCLHHPKSGLGEPSVLPIVNTETFYEKNYQNTVALISTKQPVPRCPPQQALTILIELQMSLKNNNQTRLKSCAWTKIPLFDSKNRLLSGRWKCVLKNLPIKSETILNNLEALPDYGDTELFYRLVNLRDSDEQTNAPISPAYADQYVTTAQY
ncbi:unnamed protein product [Brachionus calyciflorus]|uniref:Coiled-coil domain-containing protein 17 n=1 Tax=Brachionus calyciflorus TaxID=104777 RepID=A0A813ME42_9BILA|nr:unnamed protein product [Brachionus calyciflorus]